MNADPFRALHDANRQRVYGLLARIVGPQDAEDLAQVVFAKAAQALPGFRSDAQPSTWLYRIAANVASDWLRGRLAREANLTVQLPDGRDREAGAGDADAAIVDEHASPEQELAIKDMAGCIRAEIARLPQGYRDVLILGELGGLSDDEVAQTLGISRGNTKVRLHRARQELRKAIQSRCDFYRAELSCAPKSSACCPPDTSADGVEPAR
jgi:RNA polymerase sigma-70 factor (ECF subfamily)